MDYTIFRNILPMSWAFLVTIFAIPAIIHLAHKKRLLDEPNLRTMHEMKTPRLGGLAIFAGFISAITIFGNMNYSVQHLLAGCVIIFFIGLKDDIEAVSPFKKFFIQVLATIIVMFMGDTYITNFYGVFGIEELDQGISYLFTFFVIIGITNAFNLIDGLDGLAGSIGAIATSTFALYFAFSEEVKYSVYSYVAFSLLGSIVGFLRYNMSKAIIFMGDTGSLLMGFILSVLSVKFIEMKPTANAPAMAMAILIIPITDTLRVFFLRVINGKSPFSPDKNHIHHRLIGLGFSQIAVVALLCTINMIIVVLMLLSKDVYGTMPVLGVVLYGVVLSVVIELVHQLKVKRQKQNVAS
ncbi:MAG: undecaprenyl/decaprenyl-phosphate alpha-N-acetylglucosaminyl 1-phosphate transferase [Cytophagaceae bacterium]|nr:undecaprenyl/decaprenyl-phosphate alpha-N-acetylglucosaminyl 1-phosphate transferase [Cytophagaceae bacterium]MDW8457021.1 MraY family glycosyltransferase [Cytophagaceae bacterium]